MQNQYYKFQENDYNFLIKALFWLFGFIMVCAMALTAYGASIDKEYQSHVQVELKLPVDQVWQLVSSPAGHIRWRKDIEHITLWRKGERRHAEMIQFLEDYEGKRKQKPNHYRPLSEDFVNSELVWAEILKSKEGRIVFRKYQNEPTVFHLKQEDSALPYSRQWNFLLKENGAGTRLVIQENGVQASPFLRALRVLRGASRTANEWADYLVEYSSAPPPPGQGMPGPKAGEG